ncbi:MAG: hypothetical protein DCF19_09660 [Pseudanabaena frigida]|uniref:Uncharacterized protein n=1 Tax=Pseudanabaena frigida TaxID=945775 RepID=A0A2W4WAJ4_9CYAN|nr:MAG: hypothetical protein DCF19_09660 [Pseudanabaena frigida]
MPVVKLVIAELKIKTSKIAHQPRLILFRLNYLLKHIFLIKYPIFCLLTADSFIVKLIAMMNEAIKNNSGAKEKLVALGIAKKTISESKNKSHAICDGASKNFTIFR